MAPISGGYEDVYIIAGRVVDGVGQPVAGGDLRLELDQENVRAEPLRAKTNCYGDFITSFNLRHVDPRGEVRIAVLDQGGAEIADTTLSLNPILRRSDATLRIDGEWGYRCPENSDLWPGRVSVTGRIVNRTEPYEQDGVTYDAKPYHGLLRLTYVDENGQMHCPPAQVADKCEPLATDERGDFRYSYTFAETVPGTGTMQILVGDQAFNATVEPGARIAVFHVDLSGSGVEPERSAMPDLAPLAGVLAVVGAALWRRR